MQTPGTPYKPRTITVQTLYISNFGKIWQIPSNSGTFWPKSSDILLNLARLTWKNLAKNWLKAIFEQKIELRESHENSSPRRIPRERCKGVHFLLFNHFFSSGDSIPKAVQSSAFCRSRRELSNAYLVAKFGFDAAGLPASQPAENEPCKIFQHAGVFPRYLLLPGPGSNPRYNPRYNPRDNQK